MVEAPCYPIPAKRSGLLLLLPLQASFSNGAQVLPDWNESTSLCSWGGVSCQGGQVVSV